jgi:hypothetical protein
MNTTLESYITGGSIGKFSIFWKRFLRANSASCSAFFFAAFSTAGTVAQSCSFSFLPTARANGHQ